MFFVSDVDSVEESTFVFSVVVSSLLDSSLPVVPVSTFGRYIKNGSLRRVIIEAIMTSKYLSHFDKDFGKMCIYLTENANESVFIDFYLTLEKLSNVLKGDTSDIFNNKNSFLWFALFDKFIEYGVEDDKFNDFIQEFKETLHSKEIDGVTYDCLNGQKGTKDRSSVTKRFNHLLTLMKEYLHIEDSIEGSESDVIEDDLFDTEVVEESDDKKPIIAEVTEYSAIGNKEIERVSGEVVDKDTLEFVKMCVDDGVTDADILDYEEDLTLWKWLKNILIVMNLLKNILDSLQIQMMIQEKY